MNSVGGEDRVKTEGENSRSEEEAAWEGRQLGELERIWALKCVSEEFLYSLVVKSSARPFP